MEYRLTREAIADRNTSSARVAVVPSPLWHAISTGHAIRPVDSAVITKTWAVEGDGADDEDEWGATGSWPDHPWAPIPDHVGFPAPTVFALLDAARTVTLAIGLDGPGLPMTATQARAAAFLAHARDGTPVANVAERLGITSGAATQLIARMWAKGLVSFDEHPRDGRCHLVRLTDAGRRNLERCARILALRESRLVQTLGPELATQLLPVLRDVAQFYLHPRGINGADVRRPTYP